jgi:hypothetical protein
VRAAAVLLVLCAAACGGSNKSAKDPAMVAPVPHDPSWSRALAKLQAAREGREAALAKIDGSIDEAQFEVVIKTYQEAASAWADIAKAAHDAKNERDAYDADYFLAEARVNAIELAANLHAFGSGKVPPPAFEAIAEARELATRVRDARFDDRRLSAAILVVKIADVPRDLAYAEHKASKGARGIEARNQPDMDGTQPRALDIPNEVLASIHARQDFVRKIPASADADHVGPIFRAYVGRTYFVYGRFDDARAALDPLMHDECGKSASGYVAWITLMQAATLTSDARRARSLADDARARPCAIGEAQRKEQAEILESLAKALSR